MDASDVAFHLSGPFGITWSEDDDIAIKGNSTLYISKFPKYQELQPCAPFKQISPLSFASTSSESDDSRDNDFSIHRLATLAPEKITVLRWSCAGVCENQRCALAVCTSHYRIFIMTPHEDKWIEFQCIFQEMNQIFEDETERNKNEASKRRKSSTKISSLNLPNFMSIVDDGSYLCTCWSHKLIFPTQNIVILATATRSLISIWVNNIPIQSEFSCELKYYISPLRFAFPTSIFFSKPLNIQDYSVQESYRLTLWICLSNGDVGTSTLNVLWKEDVQKYEFNSDPINWILKGAGGPILDISSTVYQLEEYILLVYANFIHILKGKVLVFSQAFNDSISGAHFAHDLSLVITIGKGVVYNIIWIHEKNPTPKPEVTKTILYSPVEKIFCMGSAISPLGLITICLSKSMERIKSPIINKPSRILLLPIKIQVSDICTLISNSPERLLSQNDVVHSVLSSAFKPELPQFLSQLQILYKTDPISGSKNLRLSNRICLHNLKNNSGESESNNSGEDTSLSDNISIALLSNAYSVIKAGIKFHSISAYSDESVGKTCLLLTDWICQYYQKNNLTEIDESILELLVSVVETFGTDTKDKENIIQIKKGNFASLHRIHRDNCVFCKLEIPTLSLSENETCLNGHVNARCTVTGKLIDSINVTRCSLCEHRQSFPLPSWITSDVVSGMCIVCGSRLDFGFSLRI